MRRFSENSVLPPKTAFWVQPPVWGQNSLSEQELAVLEQESAPRSGNSRIWRPEPGIPGSGALGSGNLGSGSRILEFPDLGAGSWNSRIWRPGVGKSRIWRPGVGKSRILAPGAGIPDLAPGAGIPDLAPGAGIPDLAPRGAPRGAPAGGPPGQEFTDSRLEGLFP